MPWRFGCSACTAAHSKIPRLRGCAESQAERAYSEVKPCLKTAVWLESAKPEERSRRRAPERLKCSYTQCPPSCHWRSLKNYVQSWRRWCQAQQKNCISVAVRQFRPGGFQNGKLSAASRNWAVPRVHCSVFEARATTTRLSYRQPTSYKKSPGERVSKDSVQRS